MTVISETPRPIPKTTSMKSLVAGTAKTSTLFYKKKLTFHCSSLLETGIKIITQH